MKKRSGLVLCAMLMGFALTACSQAGAPASGGQAGAEGAPSADASGAAAQDVAAQDAAATEVTTQGEETTNVAEVADGVFTVGFDAEYPPYGYMDTDGSYTGFDLELAQAVCDQYGWELEKKPINWDSKDMELNSGSIDCIWNGFTMNGRENDYTFSVPYVDNSQVIVVADSSGIRDLSGLSGKIVGVQAASAALELLEGDQKALADTFGELQQFGDYNTAFTELRAGALDALAIDIGVAKYQINSRGEGFSILEESLNTEQYAVGFKKGSQEIADMINYGLCQLAVDGTMNRLAEKYEIADMVSLTPENAKEILGQ